jgi:DNA-binding SARP family transcriptional activator
MSAYRADGDRGAALRCYETLRRSLADELGVAPGTATHALFVQILRDEEAPAPAAHDALVAAVLAAAREIAAGDDPLDAPSGRVVQLLTRAERLARSARTAEQYALHAAG